MKYYAKDDALLTATSKPSGAIEITEQEYQSALQAKLQGRKAEVRGGAVWIASAAPRTVYSAADGEPKVIPENEDTPEGFVDDERPSPDHVIQDGEWVLDESARNKRILDEYEVGLDAHMQEVVRGLTDAQGMPYRFENIISAITYREKTGDKRQSIAQDLYAWRSDFWDAVDVIYADVMAGNRAQPTLAELIAELPTFTAGYTGA